MSKGKKFDAAEKHFEKTRVRLTNKINYLLGRIDELKREQGALSERNSTLEEENRQLSLHVERLLEYTELSIEDIKEACAKDTESKRVAQRLNSLLDLTTFFGYGG